MSGSSARDAVIGRVRSSLGVNGTDDAARREAVASRLRDHPENLVPERGRTSGDSRIELFTRMLEGQSATISFAGKPAEIPGIVADFLRDNNLPAEFRSGSDPLIRDVPWDEAPALTRHTGRGQGNDAVSLSRASAAAAETGTLFLASGAENPTTLNFLPDTHIVVIREKDIMGSYEDAWNALRGTYGEGNMPRTVNLVSGPSRTADIDQIIVMGAHGPRRLHVILLK
mgnify:CR=1 FL=1